MAAAVSIQEYILIQSDLKLLEYIGVYIREKHTQSGMSLSCIVYIYNVVFWSYSKAKQSKAGPYHIAIQYSKLLYISAMVSGEAIAKERTGRSWLQQSPSKTDVSCLPGN